jgi:FkbM family methyltransferase
MTSNLSERFAAAVAGYERSRFSRLLHSPLRLLYSKALELYAKQFHRPVWRRAKTFWGDELNVAFPEGVSMALYRYQFVERSLTQIMLSTIKPGMVFFDVGAHFGYYSLLASHLAGSGGAVHSFEPTPSTFEVLCKNTASKPNITPRNLAMWSEPRTLEFRDYGIAFSGFNSIETGGIEDNLYENLYQGVQSVPRVVQATTVDDYVRETGVRPDILKLDAEGAEPNIIAGMEETIAISRPILTVEVGDDPTKDIGRSRELIEAVIAKGYEPFDARQGSIVPHQLLTKYDYDNILLMPA